jgi:Ca2+-dependent lipid-binding protein
VPLHLFGLRCLTLDTLSLGGLPAKLGGVKNWRTDADEVVVDVEFKLAGGDPNIVLTAHTLAGGAFPLQLAELQFFSVVRLSFSPLLPTFPCFGAISISFMGQPFFDFSLKLVAGDLMAAPGIDAAVARLIRDLVQLIVWPQRVVVPISEEGESAASRLQPRAAGVLLVHLCRARGLPATDLASGSIYPFIRMKARTHTKTHIHKRIAKITFPRFAPLPAAADAYRPPPASCHAGFGPGGRG